MKKLLSLTLALLLLLALSVPAWADDVTTGTSLISYTVDPTYSIIIPDTSTTPIAISTTAVTKEIGISAGKIYSNKELTITAASANPSATTNGEFQVKDGRDNKLIYTVTPEGKSAVKSGGTVMTATAAEVYAGKKINISLQLTGTPTYAGTYEDTITFTAALEDAVD